MYEDENINALLTLRSAVLLAAMRSMLDAIQVREMDGKLTFSDSVEYREALSWFTTDRRHTAFFDLDAICDDLCLPFAKIRSEAKKVEAKRKRVKAQILAGDPGALGITWPRGKDRHGRPATAPSWRDGLIYVDYPESLFSKSSWTGAVGVKRGRPPVAVQAA